jgi:hypothetical protein
VFDDMKKNLMAAVALICLTMTSVVFTSCKDDEKTEIKLEQVQYKLIDNLQYIVGHEDFVKAFTNELTSVIQSINNTIVNESDLINRLQAIVDTYNNQYIQGDLYLQRSSDGSNFTTIKTFTMKYGE